jgi:hypothetical protein
MTERRSLVSGLSSPGAADPKKEEAFVYGKNEPGRQPTKEEQSLTPDPAATPGAAPEPAAEVTVHQPSGRTPLTTRLRPDLAHALKRASLERQLSGKDPHTVQDILETALEPWLKEHGYLK